MIKAIFNWSGGKDSALALYELLVQKKVEIYSLVTTINQDRNRISMHGVREKLLDMQAEALRLPLKKVLLPEMPSMETYNSLMRNMLKEFRSCSVTHSVFGDIFLEDLKKYRDEKLAEVHIKGIYPLWKKESHDIMKRFIDLGFKSIVVCVNSKYLDDSFLGRELDFDFIKDLPSNVDVCGENGEFHTFVYDGPIFNTPIPFTVGEKVFKDYSNDKKSKNNHDTGFWYLDLEYK